MRIGIDLDNTVACYQDAFHAAAVEREFFRPDEVAFDKTSVRDHLRRLGRDADFTELQGYVYGPGMKHVSLYPGLREALAALAAAGHELFLVSHRTRRPFAGPPHDLHAHAREFLDAQGLIGPVRGGFAASNVFFELTKTEKVARIAKLGCHVFVDDLWEILTMEGFPATVRKVLFDPDGHHADAGPGVEVVRDWSSIADRLLARG